MFSVRVPTPEKLVASMPLKQTLLLVVRVPLIAAEMLPVSLTLACGRSAPAEVSIKSPVVILLVGDGIAITCLSVSVVEVVGVVEGVIGAVSLLTVIAP
jgi:hypothetical protein